MLLCGFTCCLFCHTSKRLKSAADVAYNTSSFPMLLSTLDTLFKVNSSAKFILGYKYRDYGEAEFWELLKNINLNARLIESTMGEQGSATEIWEFTKE